MTVSVRRSGNIDRVGKEGREEVGFLVKGRIQGCRDQDFRDRGDVGGEDGGEFGRESFGREIEICASRGLCGRCCALCRRPGL